MQDTTIALAVGLSSRSKSWKNKEMLWSELVDRLSLSTQTPETLREFIQASKEDQHRIKDVGGYVGGYLRGGKRSPENVVHRQVLTLDVDFATSDFFEDFKFMYSNAAVIHGTHKHSALEPRLRLIVPLSRACSPDEYVAIARRVAGNLGIDLFDNTTFETNRLMFWPSHPKDVTYYFEEQKGELLDADEVLASYIDWKDTSLWPTAEKKIREIGEQAKKQEDPTFKRGIVGAFCRTYGIDEAIEAFLSDSYTPTTEGRYTYSGGSTASGLIVYDNLFAYSHHGTDPASGKLCNAFDLVRVHKYSHLDPNEKSTKSFAAMEAFAMADKAVRRTLAKENLQEAAESFGDLGELEVDAFAWMENLEIDSKGGYLSTANNIDLIFLNDKHLKGNFRFNLFDKRITITKSTRWREVTAEEPMRNVDYSGVRNYIESVYGISAQSKIEDSFILEAERNAFHPIRTYLDGLVWDGGLRIDELLIKYFGAEDNIYTREAIRKVLCAAVARVMTPGCKFDYAMVLVSKEGFRKSSFIKALGKTWFSDTFLGVHGKEALEALQGVWIMEMAELAGLRKAEVVAVKHFITKQEDRFRPSYGRVSEDYPRQCVFIGTTNESEFLKSPTGDRRFWPIDLNRPMTLKEINALEIDQLWAEAVFLWKQGEQLFLSPEAEALAFEQQRLHGETDERTGLIQRYLDKKLPSDWNNKDVYERKAFIESDVEGINERKYVCVAEIWCECLGKNKEEMQKYNTRDLNDILRTLPGWVYKPTTKNFGGYGKQKYYEKII